jgi:septal ring factor EnvC (AmiA/AmiB activator)
VRRGVRALFCAAAVRLPPFALAVTFPFFLTKLRIDARCIVWAAVLLLLAGPAGAQRHRAEKPARKKTSKSARATRTRRPRQKSKEQLERERQANLSRIEEAGKVLTQTTQKKEASLGQLNVIKEKLNQKQGQIQHISTQLQGIETNVHQTVKQVLSTQEQLARLKGEYGKLMYAASKTSSGFNQLMFLFASESFNQFVLRLRYVRQYTEERQKQALRIIGAQQQLSHELDGLTQQRQRQKSLLTTQLVENRNLIGLKTEQDEVVQQLSQQEQGLRQELAERQQAVARLDDLIAQRVREEIARAAHAAAPPAAPRNPLPAAPITTTTPAPTPKATRPKKPPPTAAPAAWPLRPKRRWCRRALLATGGGCPGQWPGASCRSTLAGTRTRCCAT